MAGRQENKEKAPRKQNKFIEFKVREKSELLEFLIKAFNGISRNAAKSFLANRQVLVNMKLATQYNMELIPGMTVYVNRGKGQREFKNKYFSIVYEDPYLIVIEKNSGLLTISTASEKERTAHAYLNEYVRQSNKNGRVYIVHRLDRDTSGLLVFAKDEKTKKKLQDNWNDIVKERKYVAVLSGEIEKDSGTVTSWLMENKVYVTYSSPLKNNGDKAVTHYKTIKRANGYSLVELELETADAVYYFFKAEILSGMVTYSTDKSFAANLVTIPSRRAFEVINLNRRGIKPEKLDNSSEGESEKRPADLLEQESVTRFDKQKEGKKKKKKNKASASNREMPKEGQAAASANQEAVRNQPKQQPQKESAPAVNENAAAANGKPSVQAGDTAEGEQPKKNNKNRNNNRNRKNFKARPQEEKKEQA